MSYLSSISFGVVGPTRARPLQDNPAEIVRTSFATSSGRSASRATNAYAVHSVEIVLTHSGRVSRLSLNRAAILPYIFTPRLVVSSPLPADLGLQGLRELHHPAMAFK